MDDSGGDGDLELDNLVPNNPTDVSNWNDWIWG
jgi:hypothetical protein